MGNASSGLKPMVNSEITVRLKTDKTNPKTTLNGTLVGVSGNNIIVNDRDCEKHLTLSLNTYVTDSKGSNGSKPAMPPQPSSPPPRRPQEREREPEEDDEMDGMPPPPGNRPPPPPPPPPMMGGKRSRRSKGSKKSKRIRRNKTSKR